MHLQVTGIKFENFMIDRSTAETKALQIMGIMHHYCKFHLLQDVERWCKSSSSGLSGSGQQQKQQRSCIYSNIRKLQVCTAVLHTSPQTAQGFEFTFMCRRSASKHSLQPAAIHS